MRKQDSIRRAHVGTKLGVWSFCASLVIGLGACGNNKTPCHAMSLASGLYGQTVYSGNGVNQNMATPSLATLASPAGGMVTNASAAVGFLADTGNNRILGFNTIPATPSGQVSDTPAVGTAAFVLGQGSPTTTGIGTGARADSPFGLSSPQKVALSSDGTKLVVADTGNNRVLIWNTLPSGNVAPDIVLGQTDLNGSKPNLGVAAPTAATLYNPTSAVIYGNSLIVVDQNNSRVLIWDMTAATFGTGSSANVELGQDDSTGTGFTTATRGYFNSTLQTVQFTRPTDAFASGSGLFVSDSANNRVLYYSQLPQVNNTTADAVVGQPSGFSTTNPGLSSQLLNGPTGVYSDGTSLYVADTGNNRVVLYSLSDLATASQRGITATNVIGQQDFTHGQYNDDDQNSVAGDQTNDQSNTNATQNTLHSPSGVFVANGTIFVSDRGNNRVTSYPVGSPVDGTNTDASGIKGECNGYNPIPPNGFN